MPVPPELKFLLPTFGTYSDLYQPQSVETIAQSGFSGAGVWKVTTQAGDFALRQWPRRGLSEDRLRGLHRLLRHVHVSGITQTAVPVSSLNGSTLVEIQDRLWQLEPWMPGVANFHDEPSDVKLRAAMSTLAHWHRAAATFAPEGVEQQWFATQPLAPSPGIAERIKRIHFWTPNRLESAARKLKHALASELRDVAEGILAGFRAAAPVMHRELQAATSIPLPLQPCLRDVWHDHLLFSGDKLTGLIDPGACRTETVAGDIARLVGSLVKDDRPAWESALEAYQNVRPLTLEERGAVELFDRSGVLLSGMTWIDWLVIEQRPVGDQNRILERMQTILNRLQLLV